MFVLMGCALIDQRTSHHVFKNKIIMDRKERRKAGKEFEKQIVDQTKSQNERQAKKAEFKKMPFYKKMIGYLVVPILLAMWIIDRI